jgi:hypothetical protein
MRTTSRYRSRIAVSPSAGAARELFRGRAGAQKSTRLSRYRCGRPKWAAKKRRAQRQEVADGVFRTDST